MTAARRLASRGLRVFWIVAIHVFLAMYSFVVATALQRTLSG